jgi:hypothetical protein
MTPLQIPNKDISSIIKIYFIEINPIFKHSLKTSVLLLCGEASKLNEFTNLQKRFMPFVSFSKKLLFQER